MIRIANALCWIGIHAPVRRIAMDHLVSYCRRCQSPKVIRKIQPYEAFSMGQDAFHSDQPMSANPFTVCALADEWELGWYESFANAEERKAR